MKKKDVVNILVKITDLKMKRLSAERNAKRQRVKEKLRKPTRISSEFWFSVARDYGREIKGLLDSKLYSEIELMEEKRRSFNKGLQEGRKIEKDKSTKVTFGFNKE